VDRWKWRRISGSPPRWRVRDGHHRQRHVLSRCGEQAHGDRPTRYVEGREHTEIVLTGMLALLRATWHPRHRLIGGANARGHRTRAKDREGEQDDNGAA
jgi:hypothetical protein